MAKPRFQLDEHLSHAIARGLVRLGHDAVTATEAGVLGLPDELVLARCHIERRVIVTHDADYLRFHHAQVAHSGIAYFRQGSRSVGEVVDFLSLIAEAFDSEEMIGRLEYL